MQKKFDYVVYIGRMQPPTKAHIANINKALSLSEKVIVLFGSSYQPRTIKNPWSWTERATMVTNQLPAKDHTRLIFGGIHDHRYNDNDWVQEVQVAVKKITSHDSKAKIGIIGCKKDSGSYFLDLFPQWKFIEMENVEDINATSIRNDYFSGSLLPENFIDKNLYNYLISWKDTNEYKLLVGEYKFQIKHDKQWENSPYPVTFTTVDSIVIQSGHVLLIQRRAAPGKGLWALPGGYLDVNETIFDSAIRELLEETKIKLTKNILLGSLRGNKVFDFPGRSLRGRIITHAFAFELQSGELVKVKGADDAAKAKWFPISDVLEMEEHIFEDHLDLIKTMLSYCTN